MKFAVTPLVLTPFCPFPREQLAVAQLAASTPSLPANKYFLVCVLLFTYFYFLTIFVRLFVIIRSCSFCICISLNLPAKNLPAKIRWLNIFWEFPAGLGIPPLEIQIMLESSPLKSRILVQRLAASSQWSTEVPLRRSALVRLRGDPWETPLQLETRHSWAPIKTPRGQASRSPRLKVTAALSRSSLPCRLHLVFKDLSIYQICFKASDNREFSTPYTCQLYVRRNLLVEEYCYLMVLRLHGWLLAVPCSFSWFLIVVIVRTEISMRLHHTSYQKWYIII